MPVKSAQNNNMVILASIFDPAINTLDLAGNGLLVEALGVALLDDVERGIGKDLDKGQASVHVQHACSVAVGAKRADERGDGDGGGVGKQLGHLADAADVLGAVGVREAQVLVQAKANVVAVEAVRVDTCT